MSSEVKEMNTENNEIRSVKVGFGISDYIILGILIVVFAGFILFSAARRTDSDDLYGRYVSEIEYPNGNTGLAYLTVKDNHWDVPEMSISFDCYPPERMSPVGARTLSRTLVELDGIVRGGTMLSAKQSRSRWPNMYVVSTDGKHVELCRDLRLKAKDSDIVFEDFMYADPTYNKSYRFVSVDSDEGAELIASVKPSEHSLLNCERAHSAGLKIVAEGSSNVIEDPSGRIYTEGICNDPAFEGGGYSDVKYILDGKYDTLTLSYLCQEDCWYQVQNSARDPIKPVSDDGTTAVYDISGEPWLFIIIKDTPARGIVDVVLYNLYLSESGGDGYV